MIIEPISGKHNRLAFSCGNEKLDRYIHENARQAKRKGLAATFVATNPQKDPNEILGYYCLSSFMIEGLDIPEVVRKYRNLPRHRVGATLLGRLAVATPHQKRGIGELLVADALKRAYMVSSDVGSVAIVVDAINQGGMAWYERLGFMPSLGTDMRLVMMMDTIREMLPEEATSQVEQADFWSA